MKTTKGYKAFDKGLKCKNFQREEIIKWAEKMIDSNHHLIDDFISSPKEFHEGKINAFENLISKLKNL